MSAFSRQLLMILGATVLAVGLIAVMVGLGDGSGAGTDRVSNAKTGKPKAQAKSSKDGSFTDSRDGKKYRTVKIGTQTWMAENLNYKTGQSWCYDNDESNCNRYGRLYDWNTALTVCPRGWHLPSRQEWDNLSQAVGGIRKPDDDGNIDWVGAGEKLKAASGWNNNGNSTDEYGFSALPGGSRHIGGGSFYDAGSNGDWWSATADGSGRVYGRGMSSDNDYVYEYYYDVDNGFSVRCVGD
jgi:uncharacterized protein (TIGR02145 family)